MNGKKIILLSLALLLPVGIFLFLKFFGRNQFDVPPLHQDSILTAGNPCNLKYQSPYVLPDSIMEVIGNHNIATLYILNYSTDKSVLQRVSEEFDVKEVGIIAAADTSTVGLNNKFVKDCVLLLEHPFDIVLIDNEKRVRGYYKGNDREEIDRLLVELSIILKKY